MGVGGGGSSTWLEGVGEVTGTLRYLAGYRGLRGKEGYYGRLARWGFTGNRGEGGIRRYVARGIRVRREIGWYRGS